MKNRDVEKETENNADEIIKEIELNVTLLHKLFLENCDKTVYIIKTKTDK